MLQLAPPPPAYRLVLDEYQRTDYREGSVLVAGDDHAMRMIAAWSPGIVRMGEPQGIVPTNPATRWEWLWSDSEIDILALAELSNVPAFIVEQRLQTLFASRLVFPDGTISEWAKTLLRAASARLFGARLSAKTKPADGS